MWPSDELAKPLFRALFDAAADAIVVVDEAGTIVLANASCERLLGYSPEALAGTSVERLVPQRFQGHERVRTSYMANPHARAMGQGVALYALHADGHEVPVDIALTPLRVGDRQWSAAALRDMRSRAHGLDALRVQATALRSAANGIVITDRAGTITWVNPAACAITGYRAEELVGQHTRILKSGGHDPAFYQSLWQTITRGETWTGTIVNRRKDGTLYHEEQTIAPVLDDAGQVSHFIAIKQDISERRRSEEALAAAHAELAARIAEIESLNRQLHEQAIRDPLTNLHNRRYFEEAISRDAARAVRANEPLTIAAIDIDHFKSVNDAHGHAVGDQVLRQLAGVLSTNVRASDLVCRVGGEEFIVALPGSSLASTLERAEHWRARIEASTLTVGAGIEVRCTISIGVAFFREADESIETTLLRADAALYEAKRGGRNRVVSAAPLARPDGRG